MKVLVTGRAGSGKSAVAHELTRRGFLAFDTDSVPGLSSWQDKRTSRLVQVADNSYVDLDRLRWVWDPRSLQELIADKHDVFVCGGAENDLSFYDLFDRQFVLDVSPEIQIQRLQERTTNDYAKDPRMFDNIIDRQRQHLAAARAAGAVMVNADQPVAQVVDAIIAGL